MTTKPTDNQADLSSGPFKRSGILVTRSYNYLLQADGETSGPDTYVNLKRSPKEVFSSGATSRGRFDLQAELSKASGPMKHQLDAATAAVREFGKVLCGIVPTHGNRNWFEEMRAANRTYRRSAWQVPYYPFKRSGTPAADLRRRSGADHA